MRRSSVRFPAVRPPRSGCAAWFTAARLTTSRAVRQFVGVARHTEGMKQERERLKVVGTGMMDSFNRAAVHFEQLAREASTIEDLLARLDEAIESARVALVEC